MADENVLTSTGLVKASELARSIGSKFIDIDAATIIASKDWQGLAVRFKRACVVTIPSDLPADFSCGWSQETAGAITFQAGGGATIQSVGNLLSSSGQYSIGGISGWGTAGVFRLYGNLA